MIVDLDMKKWVDRQHYRMDAEYLGRDEFGSWLAIPAGTPIHGPTGDNPLWYSFVTLIPDDAWWVASWNDERDTNHGLYVDITTVSVWVADDHVTCVDLDLDVIRRRDGTVFLDDEDEFAENRLKYGYPNEVVAGAEAAAQDIIEAVSERREPFDAVGARWLDQLTRQ
jgi:uncharacterized protein